MSGLLAAAALLDHRVALRAHHPAPVSVDEVRAAVQYVEARAQRRDRLVHSPLVGARLKAELARFSPERPQSPGRAAWVIDVATPQMFLARSSSVAQTFGAVVVRYAPAVVDEDAPVYTLSEALGPRTAVLQTGPHKTGAHKAGATSTPCDLPRPEGGYRCRGASEWMYVAPVQLTVEGKPFTAVWAHPQVGAPLNFRLPVLERASRLRVSGALSDDAASTRNGAAVYVDVRVNEQKRSTLSVPNRRGVRRRELAVPAGAKVELWVRARRDGRRHFGLEVEQWFP